MLGYQAKPIFSFGLLTYATCIAGWITACEAVKVARISVAIGLAQLLLAYRFQGFGGLCTGRMLISIRVYSRALLQGRKSGILHGLILD